MSTAADAPPKLRSCVTCRARKVRCDKRSPCSNCRRAQIACVAPDTNRPPRWARQLDRIARPPAVAHDGVDPSASMVMDRLRSLENLVKDLRAQLALTTSPPVAVDLGANMDTSSSTQDTTLLQPLDQLNLQESARSPYASTGFWSRVHDELDELKTDGDGQPVGVEARSDDSGSPEQTPSTQEHERAPWERHAFLFQHHLRPARADLREFRPLPSQIPFLINIFSENVNFLAQIVHVPSVSKMMRELRQGGRKALSPEDEALMFSIYYAAVTSMEEDDVMTNFGASKAELNLKYRFGLEHALANADFLTAPSLTLVQAFSNFLLLAGRHDNPKFVWMMTGLAIRMGQAVGLHRDSSHARLSPFEAEMRRRAWWALCKLDGRASEDQGTDVAITYGSFDTKLPLNVRDADLSPESKEAPPEYQGMTEMTFPLVSFEISLVIRQMMAQGEKSALSLEAQSQLLDSFYEKLNQKYLQYANEMGDTIHWAGVTGTRLILAKMTLFIYLPLLFSSPKEAVVEEVRTKPFIAAIEVAEYNHALFAEKGCRHWRWSFETYTHWNAIVYLLGEIARRPLSPTVERAWVALHSRWLIPPRTRQNENSRIWGPLRRLMAKARRHRDAELRRLRADAGAVDELEAQDRQLPAPASWGLFTKSNSNDPFRARWRRLVAEPDSVDVAQMARPPVTAAAPASETASPFEQAGRQAYTPQTDRTTGSDHSHSNLGAPGSSTGTRQPDHAASLYDAEPSLSTDWPGNQPFMGTLDRLWGDADLSVDVFADADMGMNVDVDTDMNWHEWLESARGIGWVGGQQFDS